MFESIGYKTNEALHIFQDFRDGPEKEFLAGIRTKSLKMGGMEKSKIIIVYLSMWLMLLHLLS